MDTSDGADFVRFVRMVDRHTGGTYSPEAVGEAYRASGGDAEAALKLLARNGDEAEERVLGPRKGPDL